jgi:hypothetical protein
VAILVLRWVLAPLSCPPASDPSANRPTARPPLANQNLPPPVQTESSQKRFAKILRIAKGEKDKRVGTYTPTPGGTPVPGSPLASPCPSPHPFKGE